MSDSSADHTIDITEDLFYDLKKFISSNPVIQNKGLAGTKSYTVQGKDRGHIRIMTQARTTRKIYIDLVGDDKEITSLTHVSEAQWSELEKLLEKRCKETTVKNTIHKFLQEQLIR